MKAILLAVFSAVRVLFPVPSFFPLLRAFIDSPVEAASHWLALAGAPVLPQLKPLVNPPFEVYPLMVLNFRPVYRQAFSERCLFQLPFRFLLASWAIRL